MPPQRVKNKMHIELGATGKVIKGDVLDANKASLEARLRDIDSCLYVEWNPEALHGYGCWQLRRRPETKSVYDYAVFEGNTYSRLEYVETGINHIKDMPFLDHRILDWVKQADMWGKFIDPNHVDYQNNLERFKANIEKAEREHKAKLKKKARDELKYRLLHDRSVIRDLRNRINSGVNPNLLGKYWGSTK